jgi:FAD/FMN-containing dehydrogenase
VTRSLVARPATPEDCAAVLEYARERGLTITPRGSGYSYADMILNDGQIVLETRQWDRILAFDPGTGRVRVEPGVTVAQVLAVGLIHGWTLSSCTGGMGVSMGGAVSNNVHGKDSWKDGNFGENVISVTLLLTDGLRLTVSREVRPEVFRAVVGGMGMLGVILAIDLQLKRVPSVFVEARTMPVRNLAESIETMERHRGDSDFMISWVDAFAKGQQVGRGTVELARFVESDASVSQQDIDAALVMPKRIFGVVPAAPAWAVGKHFFRPRLMKLANIAKYHMNRWRGVRPARRMLFPDFNFMLNKIPGWKGLYRPYGYVELQPILPRTRGIEALQGLLKFCQKHRAESVLCAAKLHKADDFLISFEGDGYDFGVDVTLKGRSRAFMQRFAREFYGFVADAGGKAFLAKDELLPQDLFHRMYPQAGEFVRIKNVLDPAGLLKSDMYRRLFEGANG